MTLLRETPKDHGLLLDHDPKGMRRISITLAGRTPKDEWAPNPERRGRTVLPVLSARLHGPVENAGEATSTPGHQSQAVLPYQRGRGCSDPAPYGRVGTRRKHQGSRITRSSHCGHAPMRELLVVRLRPESEQAWEGDGSADLDVWINYEHKSCQRASDASVKT